MDRNDLQIGSLKPILGLGLNCDDSEPSRKTNFTFNIIPLSRLEEEVYASQHDEGGQSKKKKRRLSTDSEAKSVKRRTLASVKVCATPKAKKKLFTNSKIKKFKNSPKQLSARKPLKFENPPDSRCTLEPAAPSPLRPRSARTTTPKVPTPKIPRATTPIRPRPTTTPLRCRLQPTPIPDTPSTVEFLRMEELCRSPPVHSPLTAITSKLQKISFEKSPHTKSREVIAERLAAFNADWEEKMKELEEIMGWMRRVKDEFHERCLVELEGCDGRKAGSPAKGLGGLRIHTLRQNLDKSVRKYGLNRHD